MLNAICFHVNIGALSFSLRSSASRIRLMLPFDRMPKRHCSCVECGELHRRGAADGAGVVRDVCSLFNFLTTVPLSFEDDVVRRSSSLFAMTLFNQGPVVLFPVPQLNASGPKTLSRDIFWHEEEQCGPYLTDHIVISRH